MGKGKRNMIGKRFGRLVVRSLWGRTKDGHLTWECFCDCGEITVHSGRDLRAGVTTSCGCYRAEMAKAANLKHGHHGSRTYSTWHAIKRRCLVESDPSYPRYGGRGIGICREWENSFSSFLAHVGERPAGKTIDRIDNSRGYEPGNVRWATPQEQANNKTNRTYVLCRDGSTRLLTEVAKFLGISKGAAHLRLKRGKLNV